MSGRGTHEQRGRVQRRVFTIVPSELEAVGSGAELPLDLLDCPLGRPVLLPPLGRGHVEGLGLAF